MKRIEGWVGGLASAFNSVAAVAVVGMMVLTCLDVLLRLLRNPIPGTYEIVCMLGAVFVSFSLARTTVDQGHIAVDFLVQRLPDRFQHAVEAVNAGICALLFTVICRQVRDLRPGSESQRRGLHDPSDAPFPIRVRYRPGIGHAQRSPLRQLPFMVAQGLQIVRIMPNSPCFIPQ